MGPRKKSLSIRPALVVRIALSVLAAGGIVALLVASATANPPDALNDEVITPIVAALNRDHPAGLTEVERNNRFILYADLLEARIRLEDTLTDGVWDSAPDGIDNNEDIKGAARLALGSLLDIRYADRDSNTSRQNSVVGCVNRDTLGADRIDGGVRFDFHFSKEGFLVPLEITLTAHGLSVRVPLDGIREASSSVKLISVTPLPNFGAGSAVAGAEDEGYALVPDGSGALIPFGLGRGADYSQRVYGADGAVTAKTKSTLTQTALLPVFGIRRNGLAVTAIITEGDARASVKAATALTRSPYTTVCAEFIYRESTLVDVSQKTFESTQVNMFEPEHCMLEAFAVEYRLCDKTDAGYTEMAGVYRDYLTGDLGVSADAGNAPLYIELLGGVMRQQSILGIPVNAVSPVTTYSDAAALVRALQDAGVDRLSVKYTAWMKNGTQNYLPSGLAAEGALGGKAGLKSMIAALGELGAQLHLDLNLTDMRKGQLGYGLSASAAQSVQREPAAQYAYKMSTFQIDSETDPLYLLRPLKLGALAEKAASWMSGLDAGISAGTLGQKLYSDFSKTPTDRGVALAEWERAMAALAGDGGVMFSAANAYAIPYASALLDAPTSSSRFAAEERAVPFYQIALHGLRAMSVPSVNGADSARDALLYAVETGVSLKFTLGARNVDALIGTEYAALAYIDSAGWLPQAAAMYGEVSGYLARVAGQAIVAHERLADGVFRTAFEDGTAAIVNYNDNDVQAGGITVAGKGFVIQ